MMLGSGLYRVGFRIGVGEAQGQRTLPVRRRACRASSGLELRSPHTTTCPRPPPRASHPAAISRGEPRSEQRAEAPAAQRANRSTPTAPHHVAERWAGDALREQREGRGPGAGGLCERRGGGWQPGAAARARPRGGRTSGCWQPARREAASEPALSAAMHPRCAPRGCRCRGCAARPSLSA